MSAAGWVVSVLVVAALLADVVLARFGFLTISKIIKSWGLRATIVPLLGGALGGHIWHDLVPSLHWKPLPAHVAFFSLIAIVGIVSQEIHVPREVLAALGWVIAALLVPA